jgi:hypothetical protein
VVVELLELHLQQEILLLIVSLNVHLLLLVINSGSVELQELIHVKFLAHKRLIALTLIQLLLVSSTKQYHAAIGHHQHWSKACLNVLMQIMHRSMVLLICMRQQELMVSILSILVINNAKKTQNANHLMYLMILQVLQLVSFIIKEFVNQ